MRPNKRERTRLAKAELWMQLAVSALRWTDEVTGQSPGSKQVVEWPTDEPMMRPRARYPDNDCLATPAVMPGIQISRSPCPALDHGGALREMAIIRSGIRRQRDRNLRHSRRSAIPVDIEQLDWLVGARGSICRCTGSSRCEFGSRAGCDLATDLRKFPEARVERFGQRLLGPQGRDRTGDFSMSGDERGDDVRDGKS